MTKNGPPGGGGAARPFQCERCGKLHPRGCRGHHKRHAPGEPLEPCDNSPMRGRLHCRMHGGKSLRGVAHPRFTRGKFVDALPPAYQETARRMLADPEILALREHLALLDARLFEQLGRLDRGESSQGWEAARAALRRLKSTTQTGDEAGIRGCLAELESIVNRGTADEVIWREALHTIAERRKLSETEARRIERSQAYVTADQMVLLSHRFVDLGETMLDRMLALLAAEHGLDLGQAEPLRRRILGEFAQEMHLLGAAATSIGEATGEEDEPELGPPASSGGGAVN